MIVKQGLVSWKICFRLADHIFNYGSISQILFKFEGSKNLVNFINFNNDFVNF